MRAVNSNDAFTTSDVVTATTDATFPVVAKSTSATDGSTTVDGSLTMFDGADSVIVYINYAESGHPLSNFGLVKAVNSAGDFQLNITRLNDDTEYGVQIRATTPEGTFSSSDVVSANAGALSVPSGSPQTAPC